MTVVLKIENLWKEYRLGVFGHGMLFRDLQSWWARARGHEDPNTPVGQVSNNNGENDRIWALRDVSVEVEEGEVLGIIGRNGAGKSTLLKILSRVTAPTKGSVKIRGRVASLLEVGTGFHPELTGRENTFLNGAILGMTRAEIRRKFDEIIDFAGIEQFVDTPVKRYSSGMYVRLAFAVAAHLEPEILVVDEVLAVGDAEFQKKCLGKMGEVAKGGRTILFVSHNMTAVENICRTAILMDRGRVAYEGKTIEVMEHYRRSSAGPAASRNLIQTLRSGGNQHAIRRVWIEDDSGNKVSEIPMGARFAISYSFQADHQLVDPGYGFALEDALGGRITTYGNYVTEPNPLPITSSGTVRFLITRNVLLPGTYSVCLGLSERQTISIDYIRGALDFMILPSDYFGTGKDYHPTHGFMFLDVDLDVTQLMVEDSNGIRN